MILIGQYDSPFVRRVGIAMVLYGLPFEHRPWSTFGDADKIRPYNPLTRVPTLVLDNGEVLLESHMMLDYLDSLMPAERRMFPTSEPGRHQALKVAALATGLGDKSVSLFYERRLHRETSQVWVDRCVAQISGVLADLEADRAERTGEYWLATASATPISRLRRPCVFLPRRIRPLCRWVLTLPSAPTRPGLKRCRCSRRSVNRSPCRRKAAEQR
jgi:glutathione S-transferase